MTEKDKLLKQFFEALQTGKLRFTDLLSVYVGYLEAQKSINRAQIVESAVLLSVFDEPKLWRGTKKDLKDRVKKAIDNAEIFDKPTPESEENE